MAELARPTSEAAQRSKLTVTRRQAGALLGLVTVIFLTVTIVGADGWRGYLQATAEAAMVGGLADWFAVTALFRRPLGLPIPHTAIIPERKERFGETLGSFISDSFLNEETIVERLHTAKVADRAVDWLAAPANADRVASYVLDSAVVVADFLRDDDIQGALEGAVRSRIESLPLAPAAGRLLESMTRERGRTLLMVTHDESTLDRTDVVFRMGAGAVTEEAGGVALAQS